MKLLSSECLSQCWIRYVLPYRVIQPQWVNLTSPRINWSRLHINYLYTTVASHESHDVSNHQQLHSLLYDFFIVTLNMTSKLYYSPMCTENLRLMDSPHKEPVMRKAFACHNGIIMWRLTTPIFMDVEYTSMIVFRLIQNQVMLLYSTLYVFISGYIITLHFSVRDQCLSRIGACCNARDEYNRDKISSTRKYSLVISVVLQISGHREISANSIWTSSLLDGGPFQSGRSCQVVSHERQNKMIN